jgi:hypothetical protein
VLKGQLKSRPALSRLIQNKTSFRIGGCKIGMRAPHNSVRKSGVFEERNFATAQRHNPDNVSSRNFTDKPSVPASARSAIPQAIVSAALTRSTGY